MLQSPTFQIELVLLDHAAVPRQAALVARRLLAEILGGAQEVRRISPGAAVLFEWLEMVLSWKLDGSAPAGPLKTTKYQPPAQATPIGGPTPLRAGGMLQLSASWAADKLPPGPCLGVGTALAAALAAPQPQRPPQGLRRPVPLFAPSLLLGESRSGHVGVGGVPGVTLIGGPALSQASHHHAGKASALAPTRYTGGAGGLGPREAAPPLSVTVMGSSWPPIHNSVTR